MERNYLRMEKLYTQKIKNLYQQLNEKDHEYNRLRKELTDLKRIGNENMRKVGEFAFKHIHHSPSIKVKNKGKNQRTINRKLKTQHQGSNFSSQDNLHKISSPQRIITFKRPMFERSGLSGKDTISLKNNSSDELTVRLEGKKFSPRR